MHRAYHHKDTSHIAGSLCRTKMVISTTLDRHIVRSSDSNVNELFWPNSKDWRFCCFIVLLYDLCIVQKQLILFGLIKRIGDICYMHNALYCADNVLVIQTLYALIYNSDTIYMSARPEAVISTIRAILMHYTNDSNCPMISNIF